MISSVFGCVNMVELKTLIKTKSNVTKRAMRPGIASTGTRKLIQEMQTNIPEGR